MNVILFDGQCLLCNRFIAFLLRRRNPQLFFCDLHSEAGREILERYQLPTGQFSTVYFLEGDSIYAKSTAVLRILRHLSPGYAALARMATLFPLRLRDAVYDWVARNRHRIQKGETCLLPDAAQRRQILG